MKRFIVLLSIVAFASCSLLPDNESKNIEAISAAEKNAKLRINEYTGQEINRSKEEISAAVTAVISKADTTLTKKFQQVESSLNARAEETKQKLSSKISGIEDRITKAMVFSIIGIAIGLIGIILAFVTYRKKPRTNVKKVIEIIKGEMGKNLSAQNSVGRIGNSSYSDLTQSEQLKDFIECKIEAYINSKRYKEQYFSANNASKIETNKDLKANIVDLSVAKTKYQIFAKESNSMVLSNIQDTYQKGKSIFKLIMNEPNATIAEVSVCIEQEEVKQRIFKFDSQYLEPICTVTRSSNEPSEIVIKSIGTAERVGEDWIVIKPVFVEIK